jgi:hypothetical protein
MAFVESPVDMAQKSLPLMSDDSVDATPHIERRKKKLV